MTSPQPPAPSTTGAPAPPVTASVLPPPPAGTVTETSTVVIPPPVVNIAPPASGPQGWAVPLATLVAALIAACFLTVNEVLKRRREDRRQWDKEIRDHCAQILTATDAVVKAVKDISRLTLTTERQGNMAKVDEHVGWFSYESLVRRSPSVRKDRRDQQVYELESLKLEKLSDMQLNIENLRLIAAPVTISAADKLHWVVTQYAFSSRKQPDLRKPKDIGVFLESAHAIGRVRRAKDELMAACKDDIRVRGTGPTREHERFLLKHSLFYRRSPRWLRKRTYRLIRTDKINARIRAKQRQAREAARNDSSHAAKAPARPSSPE